MLKGILVVLCYMLGAVAGYAVSPWCGVASGMVLFMVLGSIRGSGIGMRTAVMASYIILLFLITFIPLFESNGGF